ncbi:MAG: hypothetical protein WEB06_12950 [Actinomycetota bacterium]
MKSFTSSDLRRWGAFLAICSAWTLVAVGVHSFAWMIASGAIVILVMFGYAFAWPMGWFLLRGMIRSAQAARRGETAGWGAIVGCAMCGLTFGWFAWNWPTWLRPETRGTFGFGWHRTEILIETGIWWAAAVASACGLALLLGSAIAGRRWPAVRLRSVALVGALVSALLGWAALPRAGGTGTKQDLSDISAAVTTRDPAWRPFPQGPLSTRTGNVAVWTGREMIVWGGQGYADDGWRHREWGDGAAYDPFHRRWRRLPAAPIGPRQLALSVWTGREVIIWGGERSRGRVDGGAAYDPATNRWRRIADAPIATRVLASVVWTGREMMVWGGQPESGYAYEDGAAYDPAIDRWRTIPPHHIARAGAATLWTGREMLIFGGSVGGWGTTLTTAASYNPRTGRWRSIETPFSPRTSFSAVWTGREAIVVGETRRSYDGRMGDVQVAAFDPEKRRWRRLADRLVDGRVSSSEAWTGRQLIIWGGAIDAKRRSDGEAFDVRTGVWTTVPGPGDVRYLHTAVWTGEEMLVWGGAGPNGLRFVAGGLSYRPRPA